MVVHIAVAEHLAMVVHITVVVHIAMVVHIAADVQPAAAVHLAMVCRKLWLDNSGFADRCGCADSSEGVQIAIVVQMEAFGQI